MKLSKNLLQIVLSALLILNLTGCSTPKPTGNYDAADVGKINKVVPGTIIAKRMVNVYGKPANTLGSPPQLSTAGNQTPATIDDDITRKTGYEYVIKLESGVIVSIVQTENLNLKPKQAILVIYGTVTRVVADEGSNTEY